MIKDHLCLFGTDKTPIEVNKENHLEEPILETFALVLNQNYHIVQKSRTTFDELKNIDKN